MCGWVGGGVCVWMGRWGAMWYFDRYGYLGLVGGHVRECLGVWWMCVCGYWGLNV